MLTQARLKEVLEYNSDTGEFFWLSSENRTDLLGKPAGWMHHKGYWDIEVDRKIYRAHRLAWLYEYGCWPKNQLDHINRNKSDNRIENLREATNGQNGANSKARPSYSNLKGAHWHSRDKKWFSHIWHNGKRIWLGTFTTPEEAHAAYCETAKKLYGEFFHSGEKK
jgi:hypothetical protein